ncbi:MAG: ACT domain-containing protein, partial [Acidobacteriota bacterium]|nr:ACT domain-containing protein [Acidobacteriota bacterium]
GAPRPQIDGSEFLSITQTENELSIVCAEGREPDDAQIEPGWKALCVRGPLDFSEIGILASLTVPLAEAGVSVFVISTYDTDYVLVREPDLERARLALTAAGQTLSP